VPMGTSDFTSCSCNYSYDDGVADPTLSRFSTAHDDAYIIPLIKQAQAINPNMKLFANPWSPPAWMKTNNSQLGTSNGNVVPCATTPSSPRSVLCPVHPGLPQKGRRAMGNHPQNEPNVTQPRMPE